MKKIFIDLDGTLANFNVPNALSRFDKEPGFFLKLKPLEDMGEIDKMSIEGNIFILSASPNLTADIDKMRWVQKYLPNIPYYNIIICRVGENKAHCVRRKLGTPIDDTCILLDDYTKNLIEWEQAGGKGIKRITSIADNSTKKWKGLELEKLSSIKEILAFC